MVVHLNNMDTNLQKHTVPIHGNNHNMINHDIQNNDKQNTVRLTTTKMGQ
jgi:hypothetical protein